MNFKCEENSDGIISISLAAYLLYIASGLGKFSNEFSIEFQSFHALSYSGITAGVHRLWSHRAYKAKWPLRLMLMIFNTIAFQDCVIHWARDHRVHHKFFDTDADPHNATRGFFFSHVGWLMTKKHPDVKEAGKKVDISDLKADPFLRFQRDYWAIIMPLCCFVLPTVIPTFYWGESWTNAWFFSACFRYAFVLNITWCVNSVAHIWGHKPYDKSITPAQNISVAVFALGEGALVVDSFKNLNSFSIRLAQLSSLVPLGLQKRGAWSIPTELYDSLFGLNGENRLGVRSQNCHTYDGQKQN